MMELHCFFFFLLTIYNILVKNMCFDCTFTLGHVSFVDTVNTLFLTLCMNTHEWRLLNHRQDSCNYCWNKLKFDMRTVNASAFYTKKTILILIKGIFLKLEIMIKF